MKIIKIILLSLFALPLGTKTFAQMKPSSIYTGVTCLYDELNLSFPLGCEWQYKQFSFETAVVVVLGGLSSVSHFSTWRHLDFDLGAKYFSSTGVFMGLNYGYVDGPLYNVNTEYGDDKGNKKLRGFTWSFGYRYTINKKLYIAAFAGITLRPGYEQLEHRFFGVWRAEFISFREGITIGYKI